MAGAAKINTMHNLGTEIVPGGNPLAIIGAQREATKTDEQENQPDELKLEDLLALLDRNLIDEMDFEESWLESLPDGLYSYRERRGGARAVIALQLLMFLHQQQTANQQTIQLAQVQLQRQLQNMLAQFQQVVRLPGAVQKAAIGQILAQPQNAATITAVKQQLQLSVELPARASFPQLAAAAAMYVVTQSQPALVQFLNDAASRLAKGQLSPIAERHVQLVMDLAARVLNTQGAMTAPIILTNTPASPVQSTQPTGTIKPATTLQAPQLATTTRTAAPELLSSIRQLLTRMTGSPQPIASQQSVPTALAPPARVENSTIQQFGPAIRTQPSLVPTLNIQTSVANLSAMRVQLSAPPLESKIPPSVQTIYRNTATAIDRAVTPPMLTVQTAREIPNRTNVVIPTPATVHSQNIDIPRPSAAPIMSPVSTPIIISSAAPVSSTAPIATAPIIASAPIIVHAVAPVANAPQPMPTATQPIQASVISQPIAASPTPQPVEQIAAPKIVTADRVIETPAPQNTNPTPQSNIASPPTPPAPEIKIEAITAPKTESAPQEPASQKKSEPAAEQKPQTQQTRQPDQPQAAPQINSSPIPAPPIAAQGFNFTAPTNPANANVGVTENTVADCCKDGQNQPPAQTTVNTASPISQSGQTPAPSNNNTTEQPAANPLAKFRQAKQRN